MNLREIFSEALQIENAHERNMYLDQACADNAALRQQIEQLIKDHANLGSFLEPADSTTVPFDNSAVENLPLQSTIGPYRLLEEIGAGGMGVVYLAHQSKPVDRRVALKIIKPGMDTRQVLARFEAERQALAMMDHPNIAKVLDAGHTDSGRPYFVMELVNGIPITEFCDRNHLNTQERLELFIPVCMAIQHAHQKGIIHRDLKPSNILVTLYDDKPVPKVIDFGIAKATHQRLTDQTLFTAFGHIVGTFQYMSPEQATRNQLDIDTRSDVYSLGVVLYELLTGDTPLDRKRLCNAAWDEALRIIREEEPPLASSKISSSDRLPSVAANRRTEPAKLSASLRGEIDWITAKALEKDRARRYESASSFAEDIRRFLKNEQVLACPPTASYRVKKFVSRHWRLVSFGSLFLLVILLGLLGTLWQTRRAIRSEATAIERAESEKRARHAEEQQRQAAEASRQEAETSRREAESRTARLYLERGLKRLDSDPHSGLPWLVEAMRIEPASSPAASAHRLRVQSMIHELPTLLGHLPAKQPVFNSLNTQLAAAQDDRTIGLFKLPSLEPLAELKHELPVKHFYFSQQGDFLISVAGIEGGKRQARLWNPLDGQPLSDYLDLSENEYGMKEVPTIYISPDGERFTVIWAGMYNRWHSKVVAKVYDRATLKVIAPTFAHHSDLDMINGYQNLSRDGKRILLPRGLPAHDNRASWIDPNFPEEAAAAQQYDLMTGKAIHDPLPHVQDFYDFPIYDSNAAQIATQAEGVIKIWNAANGDLLHTLSVPPPTKHMRLSFHPHGKELLAVDDRRAFLWQLGRAEPIADWDHQNNFAIDQNFTQVIYKSDHGSSYHMVVRRELDQELEQRQLTPFGRAWFSEDGSKYILEADFPNRDAENEPVPSQVFDAATGKALTPPWRMSSTIFHDTQFSSNGRYVVSIGEGLLVWELHDRQPFPKEYPTESTIVAAAVNCSQNALAVLDSERELTVLDTNTEHLLYPSLTITNQWNRDQLTLSPDATRLLQLRGSEVLTLWDLKSRKPIWQDKKISDSKHWIDSARFIDDGKQLCLLATQSSDLDSPNGPTVQTHLYIEDTVSPSFTNPKRSYTYRANVTFGDYAGRDVLIEIRPAATAAEPQQALNILDLTTLKEAIHPLKIAQLNAVNFAFTPDGNELILADGEAWDLRNSTRIHPRLTQQRSDRVIVRRDGQEFLLIAEGGASLWSPPGRISRFSRTGQSLSSQMISPSGGALAACYHPELPILGSVARGLRLWDLITSAPITRDYELDGHRRDDCAVFFSPNGSRLYSVGDRVEILNLKELSSSIPKDEVLEAWSRVLSGKRVDRLGGLVNINVDEYEASWKSIKADSVRSAH